MGDLPPATAAGRAHALRRVGDQLGLHMGVVTVLLPWLVDLELNWALAPVQSAGSYKKRVTARRWNRREGMVQCGAGGAGLVPAPPWFRFSMRHCARSPKPVETGAAVPVPPQGPTPAAAPAAKAAYPAHALGRPLPRRRGAAGDSGTSHCVARLNSAWGPPNAPFRHLAASFGGGQEDTLGGQLCAAR